MTPSGRKTPVDFEPSTEGNVAIRPVLDDADATTWEAIVAGPLEPVSGCTTVRRTSHFSTCPQADQHRRSR